MDAWDPPSPAVAELIRTGATLLLEAPEEVFAEVDAAILADPEHPTVTDPVLAAASGATTARTSSTGPRRTSATPARRVPPNIAPEVLTVARDLVRRGLDADALHGYRVGQNVAWRRWMTLAFELTSDPDELRELLDVTARSIFTFVDETLAGVTEQIERERDELTRGTHAQRFEVVSLILEGAPIGVERASVRLSYELDRAHTAAIVWGDRLDVDPGVLEEAAEAVGRAAGSAAADRRPERVDPVGLGRRRRGPRRRRRRGRRWPSCRRSASRSAPRPAGSPGSAAATSTRSPRSGSCTARRPRRAVASYDDVQVVALATQDEERADEFVTQTLGDFATAPAELRETARVYLREQSNTTRTAQVLFTHRNTILAAPGADGAAAARAARGPRAGRRARARDPALARGGHGRCKRGRLALARSRSYVHG